jgi:opacity protein-like surface antigen
MKKRISIVLVALLLSSALGAEEVRMPPLILSSAASNGLGGPHVAYTDDIYALFVNPAALQWANQGSILELSFALIGPLDKLAANGSSLRKSIDGITKGSSDNNSSKNTENPFESLTSITNNGKLPLGFDIRGPISVGYTANGFGLGLFSRIVADARITGVDLDTTAYMDVMLPVGMSFNILRLMDHELSVGLTLKPFARVMTTVEASALDFFDDALGDDDSGFLDDVSVPVLAGLGNDLGLMYRFKRDLAAGLTVGDVYTFGGQITDLGDTLFKDRNKASKSSPTYRVPTSLNLGVAYTFRPANFWPQIPKPLQSSYAAAMLDWRSVNNIFTWDDRIHRNPILDLGFGAELGFFNFLKFRLGVRDMLPMLGIGIEPAVFKLNLAIYGKELGAEPGVNSTMAVDLSVALRLNTKKKNWPWTKPIVN